MSPVAANNKACPDRKPDAWEDECGTDKASYGIMDGKIGPAQKVAHIVQAQGKQDSNHDNQTYSAHQPPITAGIRTGLGLEGGDDPDAKKS